MIKNNEKVVLYYANFGHVEIWQLGYHYHPRFCEEITGIEISTKTYIAEYVDIKQLC